MGTKNFSLFLLILIFSLFSCSDQAPNVTVVYPQVVYDVEKTSFSLSVYGKFISEGLRIDRMELFHPESNMVWKCNTPEVVYSDTTQSQFVGYSAFLPSENGFLIGDYEVSFYDGVNRCANYNFMLNKKLEVENYLNLKNTEKYIAIYDAKGVIIYAGKVEEKQSSKAKIVKNYSNAIFYRNIIKSNDSGILYLLEKKNIK